jgi:hypothetical protein
MPILKIALKELKLKPDLLKASLKRGAFFMNCITDQAARLLCNSLKLNPQLILLFVVFTILQVDMFF